MRPKRIRHLVKAAPIHLRTPHIKFAQAQQQRLPIPLLLPQTGQHDRFRISYLVSRIYLPRHPQEHRLGANLQEDVNPLLVQGGDPIGKTDGLAHMAHPVISGGHFIAGEFAGHIRNQAHLRGVIGDAFGHRAEGSQHRLHQRGMESVGDGQLPGLDAGRRELCGNCQHPFPLARDDDTLRAIDRSNRHLVRIGCQNRLHPRLVSRQRDHHAILRQRPHQSAPRRDQF